jgi:hypothetical protein
MKEIFKKEMMKLKKELMIFMKIILLMKNWVIQIYPRFTELLEEMI